MVADLCERFDMVDPFRTLHPDVRDFTYNPSGTLRKNRSRIDFFLMSTSISASLESCSVAQGFCSKNFDHKPIFLSFRKKKQRNRPIVHNATVDHALSSDIVRLAVHKTTIFSLQGGAGPATEGLLNRELALLEDIESKLNRIIFIKGLSMVAELELEMVEELRVLEEGLMDDWTRAAPIEYLRGFESQVPADIFFENLISATKEALLGLQTAVYRAENKLRKEWIAELMLLKNGNQAPNVDRINTLECHLNEASERLISQKIGNFIKTDVLNSEKMTPLFLRLAQEKSNASLSEVRDGGGIPFAQETERDRCITEFYSKLYKIPAGTRVDFSNCVENFLGDLVNHPVIKDCMLSEAERERLESNLTLEELDEAVSKCNANSAPGIDGLGNRFIKKFWSLFREPLRDYVSICVNMGTLTETFRTLGLYPRRVTHLR
jgi:hypothetical protein